MGNVTDSSVSDWALAGVILFSAVHLHGSPSNGFKPLPLGRRYCTGLSSSVGGQTTLSCRSLDLDVLPEVVQAYCKGGMSVDHASAVAAPKSDPVFLHVKAGMTVIVTDTEGAWRMADVIWVDGGARNPKVPTLFQVADVDTGVINWVNADLVTHICPRV